MIFGKIILRIAIMEMKHIDLVGEVIRKLGKKPIFQNSKCELWNAKNVKYDFCNLEEMMKYNIATEQKAIEMYQKAMYYTNNMSLRKLWNRIIQDERLHIEIFQEIAKEAEVKQCQ